MPGRASPSPPGASGALVAWAPCALGVLVALPYLLVRYPPMGDLAFHEAAVSLLRHYGDPHFEPPGLYSLNLGEPNQLFHLLAYPLSFVVSTDWACKLVVAAIVWSVPVSAGRLAHHLGVTRWGAAIVAPVTLGWMARWGLVANLLGFSLLLASLPAIDRSTEAPTPRRALGVLGLVGLLYLAHESSMLLAAGAVVVFTARAPRRVPPLLLALSPALVAAGLAVVYHLRSASLKAPSILATSAIEVPLSRRLTELPGSLFSLGAASSSMLATSVAVVLLLIAVGWRARGEIAWRFVVFGALSFVAYLFVPEALFGSTLVYQRFLPTAFAVLVLVALPRADAAPRVAPLALALPIAMVWLTRPAFREADRSYRDLDVVLAGMEDGEAVAQLDLNPREPSVVAPVVGDAARALAVHGGRLLFSFTDAPTYPITMPAERRWDEPVKRMVMTPFAFAPAYDLTRFRYVLVRAVAPRMQAALVGAFAPEARLLGNQGSWMIFESMLPTCSVTDVDRAPPSPAPTPLAVRVRAVLAEGRR